jgi:hypothetical protein
MLVAFVGFITATATLGFRFYAPFFTGVVELSTIFLVLTKNLERNRALRKQYPRTSTAIRLSFAATFLCIRVGAWFAYLTVTLRDLFTLTGVVKWTPTIPWALVVPIIGFLPFLALTVIQLHWALLILKILLKRVVYRPARPR